MEGDDSKEQEPPKKIIMHALDGRWVAIRRHQSDLLSGILRGLRRQNQEQISGGNPPVTHLKHQLQGDMFVATSKMEVRATIELHPLSRKDMKLDSKEHEEFSTRGAIAPDDGTFLLPPDHLEEASLQSPRHISGMYMQSDSTKIMYKEDKMRRLPARDHVINIGELGEGIKCCLIEENSR